MKKYLLIALTLLVVGFANAQTVLPQYYVGTSSTSSGNYFPFGAQVGCGDNMVQLLYKPANWVALPPTGFITDVFFRWYSGSSGTNSYTNLTIKFAPTTL